MQRTLGELGRFRIVRDHHDGLAVFAIEHLQKPEDFISGLAVRSPVGSSQTRICGSTPVRAQSRHAVPGRRELPQFMLGAVREPDDSSATATFFFIARPKFRQQQRRSTPRPSHRHQVVELEHEADCARASWRAGRFELVDTVAADADRPQSADQAANQVEQRVLPEPTGPSARRNHPWQCRATACAALQLLFAARIASLGDVADLDHGVGHETSLNACFIG